MVCWLCLNVKMLVVVKRKVKRSSLALVLDVDVEVEPRRGPSAPPYAQPSFAPARRLDLKRPAAGQAEGRPRGQKQEVAVTDPSSP